MCWVNFHYCVPSCRAWSETEKECELILAARAFRRLMKRRPATPYPPEVGV